MKTTKTKTRKKALLSYECGNDREWSSKVFYTKKAVKKEAIRIFYRNGLDDVYINEYRGKTCLTIYVLEAINDNGWHRWNLLPIEETIESDKQLKLW